MKIQVLADKTIGQLQDEFHEVFPYLKLEFFTKPHKAYEGSPSQYQIKDLDMVLGAIEPREREGGLYIEPEMPTWQLERLFEREFGLHVQVFRKSGTMWLETSRTDDLTLEQQNAKGKASTRAFVPEEEERDYREQI